MNFQLPPVRAYKGNKDANTRMTQDAASRFVMFAVGSFATILWIALRELVVEMVETVQPGKGGIFWGVVLVILLIFDALALLLPE